MLPMRMKKKMMLLKYVGTYDEDDELQCHGHGYS